MKSVMGHNFSKVPSVDIPRSMLDRSCGCKTAFDEGYLIPFFCDEALPGDTFKLRTSILARLTTPIVPFMDNAFLETFYFAVPYRLVWDNFQKFCGEQENPGDTTDYLLPQFELGNNETVAVGSLSDYLSIPPGIDQFNFCSLWHRAYNLIWNNWFRSQDLQDSVVVDKDDGPDDLDDYVLLKRGKRHDYFTSALPLPQKGPGVELPLGTTAPVIGTGYQLGLNDGNADLGLLYEGATSSYNATFRQFSKQLRGADVSAYPYAGVEKKAIAVSTDPTESGLIADLSSATAATINSIREAFQLQKMYEKDSRGGTRYTEIIKSHFGVSSPDYRLQRPEYLGGSSQRINVNPVQQTAVTSGATPLGNLGAYGQVSDNKGGFVKSFTEHCLVIGLANVRADITYQQGLSRMFSRRSRVEMYWPSFAHLGEQEILNKEIYLKPDASADNELVFGYQERYAEYRYKPSIITGVLRSQTPTPYDYWHLSEEFASLPVLNEEFIQATPVNRADSPFQRVVAVTSQPRFFADFYFDYQCARPMPVYSVPGLMDHF